MGEPTESDLSEHEEESVPLDDVLRQLLKAKPKTAAKTVLPEQAAPASGGESKPR